VSSRELLLSLPWITPTWEEALPGLHVMLMVVTSPDAVPERWVTAQLTAGGLACTVTS